MSNYISINTTVPLPPGYDSAYVVQVTPGDFNGDGKLDFILDYEIYPLENIAYPIRVMTGDGTGHFIDSTSALFGTNIPAAVMPRTVAVGDFNGDGRPDLYIGDMGYDDVPFPGAPDSLILSNGTNGLINATNRLPGITDFTHSVAAVDINGDGFLDIYVGNTANPAPYFLINDGTGHFTLATDRLPASIGGPNGNIYTTNVTIFTTEAFFDADGDGDQDLFLGASRQNGVCQFLTNDGTGHFTAVSTPPLPVTWVAGSDATDAQAIDLNNDGRLDLLVTYTIGANGAKAYLQALINQGSGNFTDETSQRIPASFQGISNALGIILADINGDGFKDILYAREATTPLALNDGTGHFVVMPAGSLPGSYGDNYAVGDVNGDGHLDLIASTGRDSVSEFTRADIWTDPGITQTGTSGNDGIMGDSDSETFNGLGGDDVIFAGSGNDILNGGPGNDNLVGGRGFDTAIFSGLRAAYTVNTVGSTTTVNGPDGTDTLMGIERLQFSDTALTIATGEKTVYADANGDGNADLILQNSNGQAAIWLASGVSIATASAVGSNPGPTWHIRGTGDFDGDSKADILWQKDSGQAAIWTLNGTTQVGGGLAGANPGPTWHVAGSGDFNGDSKSDILWQSDTGQTAIWLMNGTSVIGGGGISANPGPTWHVKGAGDFDGDGKADIIWQNDSGQAAIWLMNGSALMGGAAVGSNPGSNWHVLGAGDFDGDGKSDLLWQNNNGQVQIWLMNGTAVTSTAILGTNPGSAWHVKSAGDLDGDGKSDIVLQNDSGQIQAWFMNATTVTHSALLASNPGFSWQVANNGTVPFAPRKVNGDFDGDHKADILWQNDNGQAAIWLMNGTVLAGSGLAGGNPGPSWHVKGSGDFDGDGQSDILWQNDNGQAAVWTMNGIAITGGGVAGGNPGPSWHVKGSGDFDGDGKSDVLWQNDNGQAAIWLMNGINQVGGGLAGGNPGTSWHVVGTGDFDGDGKADILWQNDNGQAAIWLMNGSTQVGGGLAGGNPGPSWDVKGAGDFDGDGKADILWQNDNGQAAIWLMNGTNQVGGGVAGGNPGASWHIKGAGDFDGDGKADLLWQNDSGQGAVWLMNGVSMVGGGVVGTNPGTSWHLIAASG